MDYSFFTRTDKGQIVTNAERLEVYIPEIYFEEDIASIVGVKLETFGIFYFSVKREKVQEPKKYLLNLPSPLIINFDTEYSAKLKVSDMDEEPSDYRVFVLDKGTVFLESEAIIASAKNVEAYVKLLLAGKVPITSYEGLYSQFQQVQELNKVKLGVSSATAEAIIAEMCRYRKDYSVQYRRVLDKNVPVSDLKIVPIKQLPGTVSTFSGLTFENLNQSIAEGVARSRTGKKETVTSMEATLRL